MNPLFPDLVWSDLYPYNNMYGLNCPNGIQTCSKNWYIFPYLVFEIMTSELMLAINVTVNETLLLRLTSLPVFGCSISLFKICSPVFTFVVILYMRCFAVCIFDLFCFTYCSFASIKVVYFIHIVHYLGV